MPKNLSHETFGCQSNLQSLVYACGDIRVGMEKLSFSDNFADL